jgi:2,4-dienoyl-CoA reductase (NADPH2)
MKAQAAGFDAVEILASAGYLISQFLSPLTNHRTDEYGGSFENRTRFAKRVIQSIRAAVKPSFAIIVRVAGNDFVPGSNDNETAVAFAKLCEEWGADLINVTGGWHETTIPQLPGEVPHGGFSYLASAIKDAVSIPVMASNRFNLPEFAEEALAMGVADLIGFARPLIADPELPNKVASGNLKQICHCVGCNQGCLARTFFGQSIECTVNPFAGYEYTMSIDPSKTPKRVLVVGGGPVGCEAAIVLKQRGHEVTLVEKQPQLGGQLDVVSAPPGKEDFLLLKQFHQQKLHDLGVTILLNKEITKQDIIDGRFDEVILATGSRPIVFSLPKDDSPVDIVTAEEVLLQRVIPGKRVAIIGGGAAGCEVAEFLLERSTISKETLYFLSVHEAETPEKIKQLLNQSKREITIIEMKKKIGEGFDLGCGWPVLKQLKRLQARSLVLTKAKEIKHGHLVVENEQKESSSLPVDTIILAAGYRAYNPLSESLKDLSIPVHVIGDASKPDKILVGIAQAARLAMKI